ncbi:kinesin-like protein KIF13A [Haliotis rufescens]|uniref:kinesin-like protein KIF13A n=1 Tax=Haliotis rufescens TaxID=6454 RepID=UPI001EB00035|nr:kinesin-like protein KIF13A [Haliotis rufescens]
MANRKRIMTKNLIRLLITERQLSGGHEHPQCQVRLPSCWYQLHPPQEHGAQFVSLPIIKSFTEKENVCALVSWDSSIHDSPHLNRLTPANERIYVILKAVVRLSHPASMELVLRKRVCINIYKKQSLSSFTNILKNRFIGGVGVD